MGAVSSKKKDIIITDVAKGRSPKVEPLLIVEATHMEAQDFALKGKTGSFSGTPRTPPTVQVGQKGLLEESAATNVAVADYIVQCLVACGVTHVFGGHGGAIVPLVDAICKHPKLTWVYTRCELNASLAAAAYAKLKDGLGCCIGTSGPGASHLTTGLLDAELDKCPVLCITGMKNSDKIGFSDFQDIGQTELFKAAGITSSMNIIHKNGVVPLLRDAIAGALTKRACAHLAIPFDIQKDIITLPDDRITEDRYMNRLVKEPSTDVVQACAEHLLALRGDGYRVLIAFGHRAVAAGECIVQLAETLGVPIVSTLDAKGAVPEDHPQYVGVFGIFGNPGMEASATLVQTADLVISVGVDEHSQLVMSSKGIQERRLIEIDVSTTVFEMRCQAVYSLAGDICICCQQLVGALRMKLKEAGNRRVSQCKFTVQNKRVSALGGCSWGSESTISETGFKATHLTKRPATYEVPQDEITTGYCHPGQVMKVLGQKLGEGATVCVDVGDVTLWAGLYLCLAKKGQRMLASMRLGTMGYSICSAIAAGAWRPEYHTVALAGDGGVQMATNELSTLSQLGCQKLLIVVLVNHKLGRVANEIWGGADAPPAGGCEIVGPDFCKLAEAHGGLGVRLADSNPKVVAKAIEKCLAYEGLCILEVIQDPAVKPCMTKKNPKLKSSKSMAFHQHTPR